MVFRDIFSEHYVALCIFAHKYTRDVESAADIVQDAFLSLWSRRKDFDNVLQVRSFLYTCVRNKALNELEHLKVVSSGIEKMKYLASDAVFHDNVVETETFRIMRSEIDRLPTQMRTVMLLSIEGHKNAEIAEDLNVSINTVRTRKRLAYKKIRQRLGGLRLLFLLFLLRFL